jgi:hypothetical protein
MFFLGILASKSSRANDFLCCDVYGGHNDCHDHGVHYHGVGFFYVLNSSDASLLEADFECLHCLFCFASLIVQSMWEW